MNSREKSEPPPLVETGRTERIFVDGLAKVIVDKRRLHLVYYRETLLIEDGATREREVPAIVTMPIEAAMPAIRLLVAQVTENMGAIIADEGEFFWVR